MSVILDPSIALSWCFEDEASEATDALFILVRDEGALVPALFHWEISNILLMGEKRGRLESKDVAARLELLGELPIVTDPESPSRAWRETLTLARAEKLSCQDASYLELALRKGAILLTKDNALAAAGRRRGVEVRP